MGGYRRHNTILLTLIGIWFCLITFGNSEGSNLLRQLKGRSKLKKAKSTVFSSSLKGKDNAYFKAMLKKKQATSHPATEVEPQPEGDHDEHGHEPDTVREEEEHLDHGGYGHDDNVEEEEEEEKEEEEKEEEEEEEDESDFDSDKACKHLKELVEEHPDASETDIEQYLQGEGLSSEQIEKVQQDCDHKQEDNYKLVGGSVYCLNLQATRLYSRPYGVDRRL